MKLWRKPATVSVGALGAGQLLLGALASDPTLMGAGGFCVAAAAYASATSRHGRPLTDPSRRALIKAGSLGAAGLIASKVVATTAMAAENKHHQADRAHFGNMSVGEIDLTKFHPSKYLESFDHGKVSTLPDGRTLREFEITAVDVEIEVAPGVKFASWAYNGQVPGPTLRATEGDVVKVHFTNAGSHPHTIHFHGFHSSGMDGVFELVQKGQSFTYEFTAAPFGLHLYHCHTPPLKRHIHKGLYGVFIIDPKEPRPPAKELVMMMNAFDTNFDGENEVYAVNTVAHHYMRHPIEIKRSELIRIYLVNITEFDLINSFHSHATFFHEYRTGTKLEPDNFTDTIILGQGERSILELKYDDPGPYMFHAHVSEFAELGWSGMFEVAP